MIKALLGKKIGMTQIFDDQGNVVPVTVINVADWVVTQVKLQGKNGYTSLQLGAIKRRYVADAFNQDWLKNKAKYFDCIKEVAVEPASLESYKLGQKVSFEDAQLNNGDVLNVSGISRGLGFQGVVKRWNFAGGPKTHGSTFHRTPGAMSYLCREGEIQKGKKLPGHMGNKRITVKGLRLIKMDMDSSCLFVMGAVPGKKNTILEIRKQG